MSLPDAKLLDVMNATSRLYQALAASTGDAPVLEIHVDRQTMAMIEARGAGLGVKRQTDYWGVTMRGIPFKLIDAVSEAKIATRWKLMKTAPKDGRQILAFARGPFGVSDVYYGVAQWAVNRPGSIQPHVEGWFWPFAIRPTHWMELPAGPDANGETEIGL